jgi:aminoglycoside phosphotransferase (APT) family kinase protein
MAHEDVARRLEPFLARATGEAVRVEALAKLPGGACQDNFKIELESSSGRRTLVLRSDPLTSLPNSLRRRDEYDVIRTAARAGVKTPDASWLGSDLVRPGADGYFMPWVDGVALGAKVLRSPELASARAVLAGELAVELAKIHRITPATDPGLERTRLGPAIDPFERALGSLRASMDKMVMPRPALELIYRWLAEHPPECRERVLVHGDFRTGNFLVTERGLAAVLDWEFARWGSPFEDLAWLCLREWRFGQLASPVGGFARRSELYRTYEAASGRPVLPADIRFWEVMGNAVWGMGCVYQAERYLGGEESDLELIAIGPRAVEMEWEALRLIEEASS